MDDLIKDIFGFFSRNFYWLLPILFILFSGKLGENKQKKTENKMPDFGGGSGSGRNTAPSAGPGQRSGTPPSNHPRPYPTAEPQRSAGQQEGGRSQQQVYRSQASLDKQRQEEQERREQERRRILEEKLRQEEERRQRELAMQNMKTTAHNQGASPSEGITGNKALSRRELRRAIIWSEILNRPRSSSGYRRRS